MLHRSMDNIMKPFHLDQLASTRPIYAFEDLTIGQKASLMRTVMDRDLTGFAALSGDVNPVHIDDDFAARTRFGQRIAHGFFTGSLISALLGTRLPGPGAIYLSQSLQFLAPVKIGDVIEAWVEVVELNHQRRRARFFCECLVDGRAVLDGDAWLSVPGRAEQDEMAGR